MTLLSYKYGLFNFIYFVVHIFVCSQSNENDTLCPRSMSAILLVFILSSAKARERERLQTTFIFHLHHYIVRMHRFGVYIPFSSIFIYPTIMLIKCVCVCENSKYYYTRRVRKCYDKQMEMVMPDAVQCDAAIGPDCQWKQPPDPKFNKYRKKADDTGECRRVREWAKERISFFFTTHLAFNGLCTYRSRICFGSTRSTHYPLSQSIQQAIQQYRDEKIQKKK